MNGHEGEISVGPRHTLGPLRRLHPSEVDRACGVIVASAVGDALGAGYEFQLPPQDGEPVEMLVGALTGGAPGTWTDDTDLALCVLLATQDGEDLRDVATLRKVGDNMLRWYRSDPPDVGTTTRQALQPARSSDDLPRLASAHFERSGQGAGNGSLMRTGPVALSYLRFESGPMVDAAIAEAARAVSDLTHGDPIAGDACVLWSIAIDRAVRHRNLRGIHDGLALLPAERQDLWRKAIRDAAVLPPEHFTPNGYVVTALQAALSAIWSTEAGGVEHLEAALQAVIRVGDDTDTTAAIAGSLLGGRWGASAVPFQLRRHVRGWPGLDSSDLTRLAARAAYGADDPSGWPSATTMLDFYLTRWPQTPYVVPCPYDDGVLLGNVSALEAGLVETDAVVSLCRVGSGQLRREDRDDHVQVWLVDDPDPAMNEHLSFVIADAAAAVAALRDEGKTVFLHCVHGASRTPTVAATYLRDHRDVSVTDAVAGLRAALPVFRPNPAFMALLDPLTVTRT